MSAVLTHDDECHAFESAIRALHAEIANVGAHLTIDASARALYAKLALEMSEDLRMQASSGRITWQQAAVKANEARNGIMDVIRGRSTPVGRAIAQAMKAEGVTLNAIIAKKVKELYGNVRSWDALTQAQKDAVYAAVVKSAGKADPKLVALMRRLSRAGRGLLVLSLALSVYNVATADDKGYALKREVAVTGAGIAGGAAGGALAGLACGPGAPVCVTVGAFVGGALAAFGVDYFVF